MFSRSFFQTNDKFREFKNNIKNSREIIQQNISPYKNKLIVVLTGMIGAGKSSIACSLCDKSLTVQACGRMKYLEGDGVGSSYNACTTIPSIFYNPNIDFVIVDPPGFNDNRNCQQEIINTIAIDNLFDILPNDAKKYKILLVFSSSDFQSKKASALIECVSRIKKMFPDYNDIKNTFGIIITKGERDFEPSDYIDSFNITFNETSNPNSEMIDVHNFLLSCKNNIFIFPRPNENIGSQYIFNEKVHLLEFLKTNYIQNPKHEIALNNQTQNELKFCYQICQDNVKKSINEICFKIRSQFLKEKKSEDINKWITFINKMSDTPINTIKDFENAIKYNIPNNYTYDNDFRIFDDFNLFEDIVFKILPSGIDKKYLYRTVEKWFIDSSSELKQKYQIIKDVEIREKQYKDELAEQERIAEDYRKRILDVQKKIQLVSGG